MRIDVLNDHDEPIVTLDEWQTVVFYNADGAHSLEMIISWFPSQYRDPRAVPVEYVRELSSAERSLVEDRRFVERWDRSRGLAREHDLPRNEQATTEHE